MSIKYLNNKSFLARMALARKELAMLDSESVETALSRLLKDFSYNLKEIVDVYRGHKFPISATVVIDLKDKILESNNKEFLADIILYLEAVDAQFNNLAITYGQICLRCLNLKKKSKAEIQNSFSALLEHEDTFKAAIETIRNFSRQKIAEVHERKLEHLPAYQLYFASLSSLTDLTWVQIQNKLQQGKSSLF